MFYPFAFAITKSRLREKIVSAKDVLVINTNQSEKQKQNPVKIQAINHDH